MTDSNYTADTNEFLVVYRYKYWDESTDSMQVSNGMATLTCIRDGLGTPIIESGRKVPRDAVDRNGRLIVPE
jgi:hypothetical protein